MSDLLWEAGLLDLLRRRYAECLIRLIGNADDWLPLAERFERVFADLGPSCPVRPKKR